MIRVTIILACLWGTVAQAETLRVITGEHADFTRIAVLMGSEIAVTLETQPDSVVLSFANGPHQIDLADVFRRIGRSRITDITSEGNNRLRVAMACPCTPVLGRGGPGVITLDIVDAGPKPVPDLSTPEVSLVSPEIRPPQMPQLRFGGLPPAGGVAASAAKIALPLSPLPQAAIPDAHGTRLDPEMARGLQFQIARAASQGLLDPSNVPEDALAPDKPPPGPQVSRSRVTDPQMLTSRPGIQVRSDTNAGPDMPNPSVLANLDRQTIGCLPADRVDVATWGEPDAFARDLGKMQRDVFSETGRPDAKAARLLARHYLFFGMGAEARAILASADLSGGQDMPLIALAQIMDNVNDDHSSVFDAQEYCNTPAALWAVLADPAPAVTAEAQIGAIIQAFTALPWHLKSSLGPVLVQRLRSAGNTETADTVLRIIKRATDESSPALQIEEAEVSLAADSEAEAIRLLRNVAEANGQLSPEALVRMIDVEIAAGRPILSETAMLAESYAAEYRRTPIADDLWRVNVLALAATDQFDRAFVLLSEPRPEEMRANSWSATLQNLTRQASDMEFARWAMNVPPEFQTILDPDIANAVADRLIALGFAAAAETFLAGRAEDDSARLRKTLRARAALLQNRPRRAEAELTGLAGADIDRLRAETRLATGDFATSQRLFRSIDATANEVEAAFLAGNWPRVSEVGPEGMAEFGALALEPAPIIPDLTEDEPLHIGRTLLSDSERTRAVIASLLNFVEQPVDLSPDSDTTE